MISPPTESLYFEHTLIDGSTYTMLWHDNKVDITIYDASDKSRINGSYDDTREIVPHIFAHMTNIATMSLNMDEFDVPAGSVIEVRFQI